MAHMLAAACDCYELGDTQKLATLPLAVGHIDHTYGEKQSVAFTSRDGALEAWRLLDRLPRTQRERTAPCPPP